MLNEDLKVKCEQITAVKMVEANSINISFANSAKSVKSKSLSRLVFNGSTISINIQPDLIQTETGEHIRNRHFHPIVLSIFF